MHEPTIARCYSKMHEANRFAGCRAAGASDTGDGNGEIDTRSLQCTHGHGLRGLLADRAKRRKRRCLDAQHGALGVVGVGDETAVNNIGRTGYVGQRAGH